MGVLRGFDTFLPSSLLKAESGACSAGEERNGGRGRRPPEPRSGALMSTAGIPTGMLGYSGGNGKGGRLQGDTGARERGYPAQGAGAIRQAHSKPAHAEASTTTGQTIPQVTTGSKQTLTLLAGRAASLYGLRLGSAPP